MKSIEKLRTAARNMAKGRNLESHEECNLLLIIADEIEAEVAERYMELPVDVNNEPVHIGDEMEHRSKHETLDVIAVGNDSFFTGRWADKYTRCIEVSSEWHHVKPDPLKELISEAALEIIDVCYQSVPTIGNVPKISVDEDRLDEWLEANAERIREMMGVDVR